MDRVGIEIEGAGGASYEVLLNVHLGADGYTAGPADDCWAPEPPEIDIIAAWELDSHGRRLRRIPDEQIPDVIDMEDARATAWDAARDRRGAGPDHAESDIGNDREEW